MGIKQHNSLTLRCSLDGLPADWRARVEAVVRYASPAFDLYVTRVKAGARKSPEGILISISRDGAEEAWSERVERLLSERILEEMESSRAEARSKQSAQLHFELGWDGAAGASVSACEDVSGLDRDERLALIAKRHHLTADLRQVFHKTTLDPATATFVGLALQQMDHPERWALWARLLLVVAETEALLPIDVQRRVIELT